MCEECTLTFTVLHGINEVLVKCQECGATQSMRKLLSTPMLIKNYIVIKENKIGELTKEYIEANRKILEEQKKEGPLPTLFLTKNFDRNLFLGHFNQFIPSLEEKVRTFLDIAENIAEEGSKILIVSEEKELPLKRLFKERKYFQFENLQTLSSSKAFN